MHVLSTLLQLPSYRSNRATYSLKALDTSIIIIIIVAIDIFFSLATTTSCQSLHPIVIFSVVRLDLNFRWSSRYVLVSLLLRDGRIRTSSPLLRTCSFALHVVR
jgi:hypothetical protein